MLAKINNDYCIVVCMYAYPESIIIIAMISCTLVSDLQLFFVSHFDCLQGYCNSAVASL